MVGPFREAGNRLRQENDRLLVILVKISRKVGGFDKLKDYGLTDEEISFLKEQF